MFLFVFPHIFVWGSCFWFCILPAFAPPPAPPSWSHTIPHNLVAHHLSTHSFVTTLSHTIFHTTLSHTTFHTHDLVTHHLSHTQPFHTPSFMHTHNFVTHTHTHTIFHTSLCHTPFFTHHLSHTHSFVTHTHTIFHIQLCHTPSFTQNFVTHYLSHTHRLNFVTSYPASFCVAGVALAHIHLRFEWQVCTHNFVTHYLLLTALSHPSFTHTHTQLCLAWQAWHLATSTRVWRGRRGTCGNGLALVARLAWSPLVARGAKALCVASVALGDIDVPFAWQTWHLATSTCVPRGKAWHPSTFVWRGMCGTSGTRSDTALWHLVTSTFHLGGRRHRPWFPVAGVALMALGSALSHVTLSHTTPSHAELSQLFHTPLFHRKLFHKPIFHTHTQLFHVHNFGTPNSFTNTSCVFPSSLVVLQLLFLIVGRCWLVGLSGPIYFFQTFYFTFYVPRVLCSVPGLLPLSFQRLPCSLECLCADSQHTSIASLCGLSGRQLREGDEKWPSAQIFVLAMQQRPHSAGSFALWPCRPYAWLLRLLSQILKLQHIKPKGRVDESIEISSARCTSFNCMTWFRKWFWCFSEFRKCDNQLRPNIWTDQLCDETHRPAVWSHGCVGARILKLCFPGFPGLCKPANISESIIFRIIQIWPAHFNDLSKEDPINLGENWNPPIHWYCQNPSAILVRSAWLEILAPSLCKGFLLHAAWLNDVVTSLGNQTGTADSEFLSGCLAPLSPLPVAWGTTTLDTIALLWWEDQAAQYLFTEHWSFVKRYHDLN